MARVSSEFKNTQSLAIPSGSKSFTPRRSTRTNQGFESHILAITMSSAVAGLLSESSLSGQVPLKKLSFSIASAGCHSRRLRHRSSSRLKSHIPPVGRNDRIRCLPPLVVVEVCEAHESFPVPPISASRYRSPEPRVPPSFHLLAASTRVYWPSGKIPSTSLYILALERNPLSCPS